MKDAADLSRLLASPKATAILCAVILVFLLGIVLIMDRGESPTPPAKEPGSAVVAAFGQPAGSQSESDRKALESLPPVVVAPPVPVSGAQPMASGAATPVAQTYTVIGLEPGDTLNVRSGPGVQNPAIAQLPIAYSDVELTGAPVTNGSTVWVPVKIGNLTGWVARKNLSP